MRVETAKGGVDYDEDNVPNFITKTKARLRLFGCGFTDQTVITFTKQDNERQGACLLPSSAQFEVLDEGLLEYTALVDINIPVADPEPYYFCVKNAEDIQSEKVTVPTHIRREGGYVSNFDNIRKIPILTSISFGILTTIFDFHIFSFYFFTSTFSLLFFDFPLTIPFTFRHLFRKLIERCHSFTREPHHGCQSNRMSCSCRCGSLLLSSCYVCAFPHCFRA